MYLWIYIYIHIYVYILHVYIHAYIMYIIFVSQLCQFVHLTQFCVSVRVHISLQSVVAVYMCIFIVGIYIYIHIYTYVFTHTYILRICACTRSSSGSCGNRNYGSGFKKWHLRESERELKNVLVNARVFMCACVLVRVWIYIYLHILGTTHAHYVKKRRDSVHKTAGYAVVIYVHVFYTRNEIIRRSCTSVVKCVSSKMCTHHVEK